MDNPVAEPDSRLPALALPATALAGVVATFAFEARFLLGHYAGGGYFLDGGWFASLFQSDDPWLPAPRAMGDGTYFKHHVSPWFDLLGGLLHRGVGLDGFTIFALHQGAFYALLLFSLILIAFEAKAVTARAIGLFAALCVGGVGDLVFRAAEYPHFEIALLALSLLALALERRGGWRAAAPALLALPLVREDGGFYAALTALLALALEGPDVTRRRLVEGVAIAAFGAAVGALTSWTQSRAFADSTTLSNFSGDHWRHLTLAELGRRIATDLRQPALLLMLLGVGLLSRFDRRYAAGLILVSPLLALDLVAAKDYIWEYDFYYALPWLFAPAAWIAVFAGRGARASREEALTLALLAGLTSAPAQAILGPTSAFWRVSGLAITADIGKFSEMREFVGQRVAAFRAKGAAGLCATMGPLSLAPDLFLPAERTDGMADFRGCAVLITMTGQPDYATVRSYAEAAGLRREASRAYVEVWTGAGS